MADTEPILNASLNVQDDAEVGLWSIPVWNESDSLCNHSPTLYTLTRSISVIPIVWWRFDYYFTVQAGL